VWPIKSLLDCLVIPVLFYNTIDARVENGEVCEIFCTIYCLNRNPSSLPFGTDVVLFWRVGRAFEDGIGITCVEEIGVPWANLSAFVQPFILLWLGIQQNIILYWWLYRWLYLSRISRVMGYKEFLWVTDCRTDLESEKIPAKCKTICV